jgi:hypothetical protein
MTATAGPTSARNRAVPIPYIGGVSVPIKGVSVPAPIVFRQILRDRTNVPLNSTSRSGIVESGLSIVKFFDLQ